jgi:hypothetical protein
MARMTWRWLVPVVAALGFLAVAAGDAAAADPLVELTDDAAAALGPVADTTADQADPLVEVVADATEPVVGATRLVTAPALAAAEPAVESAIAPIAPVVESLAPGTQPVDDAIEEILPPLVEPIARRLLPPFIGGGEPVLDGADAPIPSATTVGTPPLDATDLAAIAAGPRSPLSIETAKASSRRCR